MSLVALGALIYAAMFLYFHHENRRRAQGKRDSVMRDKTEAEILCLGDENPRFLFAT
jgi:hypothetical protein